MATTALVTRMSAIARAFAIISNITSIIITTPIARIFADVGGQMARTATMTDALIAARVSTDVMAAADAGARSTTATCGCWFSR